MRCNQDESRCPKCGATRKSEDTECLTCGIVFEKYKLFMEKQRALAEKSDKEKKIKTPLLEKISGILFALAILNMLAFAVITSVIGGDAISGKIEDGRYYVSNRGKYTEVSQSVYTFSRIHIYSVVLMYALLFCAAGIRALTKSPEENQ